MMYLTVTNNSQFCWGGKVVSLVTSSQDNTFKAGIEVHPAMLDVSEASKIKIPLCLLASKDEDVEDVKKFEQTKDEEASQAWTPFILDTSGDGKRGDYVEPDKPIEPGKDKRIAVNEYAIAVSPTGSGTRSNCPVTPSGGERSRCRVNPRAST